MEVVGRSIARRTDASRPPSRAGQPGASAVPGPARLSGSRAADIGDLTAKRQALEEDVQQLQVGHTHIRYTHQAMKMCRTA